MASSPLMEHCKLQWEYNLNGRGVAWYIIEAIDETLHTMNLALLRHVASLFLAIMLLHNLIQPYFMKCL